MHKKNNLKLHIKQRKPVNYGNPTIILQKPELYDLNNDFSEKYDISESSQNGLLKCLNQSKTS